MENFENHFKKLQKIQNYLRKFGNIFSESYFSKKKKKKSIFNKEMAKNCFRPFDHFLGKEPVSSNSFYNFNYFNFVGGSTQRNGSGHEVIGKGHSRETGYNNILTQTAGRY